MSDHDELDDEKRKAKAFLADAYALETQADALAFYDRWADEYDAQLERGLRYLAPRALAEALARHHAAGDAPILDIGCGTGLTGCCLRDLGFRVIDGIDLSEPMLRKAEEKGVYRRLIEADLNVALPLDDGVYAAAVSTGTFTLGHVGPEPIDEVLRVLAPGAILACTVHTAIWDSKGFSAKFAGLERCGAIRAVAQETGCFFEAGEPTARYCVFRLS
jgi:predicted TPR repeat methyltransferase